MNTSINTETGEIKSGNLGKFFRTLPWREATQEEIDTSPFLLQEAKDSAIKTLASNRETLAEKTTVTLNAKTYANSQNARIAIINYIQKMDDVETKFYSTYPVKEATFLTKSDFKSLGELIEINEATLRATEIDLIGIEGVSGIKNCATPAEVETIDITLT